MKKLEAWVVKLGIAPEKARSFLATAAFAAIYLVALAIFGGKAVTGMWMFALGLMGVIIAAVALAAGAIVLRALFVISAQLSLIIFLAQEYCAAGPTDAGDNALKALLSMSLFYLLYLFGKSVLEALDIFFKADKKWHLPKVIVTGLLFLFLAGFLLAVYQVIKPIALDLCVFKQVAPGVQTASPMQN